MTTATTLKQRRKSAGLTQFELAVASGVSPATIHRIEAGRTTPTDHVVDALDRALSAQESERAASPAKKNAAPEPAQKG